MDHSRAHLIHRICFSDFEQFSGQSHSDIIQYLCNPKEQLSVPVPFYNFPIDPKSLSKKEMKKVRKDLQELTAKVNMYWVNTMIDRRTNPLLEKMTLFWHGHFACESKRFDFAHAQLCVLRENALGDFRALLIGIAKSASMILYLNNQQNRKNKPNENFARELMELFTLGRGHYSENDVKNAARAFTGWFTNRKNGAFTLNTKQHDSGTKTFLGEQGKFTGEDIIDIILKQKECALFIAQKIYMFFVNPTPNKQHIEDMAKVFRSSNYNINAMMQFVLASDWFYNREHIGIQIKSPVELMVTLGRHCQFSYTTTRSVMNIQKILGQMLFKPPNVAGWPGGKRWIDNATLLYRLNLASIIFKNKEQSIRPKEEAERKKLSASKWDIPIDINNIIEHFKKKNSEGDGIQYQYYVPSLHKESFQLSSNETEAEKQIIQLFSSLAYQMC